MFPNRGGKRPKLLALYVVQKPHATLLTSVAYKHNSKLTQILATPFLGSKLSLGLSSQDKQYIIFVSAEGLVPGILNFEAIGKW